MLHFHLGNLITLVGEILLSQEVGHSCTCSLVTPEEGFTRPVVF